MRFSFEPQIVSGTFDDQQLSFCRYQHSCRFNLLDGSERIARAVHEQSWDVKFWEVLRPRLIWTAGRVQGIRKQKQAFCNWIVGKKHARLATAIALPTQEDSAWRSLPDGSNRVL
jgi:hypothetical protein